MPDSVNNFFEPDPKQLDTALAYFFETHPQFQDREKKGIRSILNNNIALGRTRRYLKALGGQTNTSLLSYISKIAFGYRQENPELLLLQDGSTEAWQHLIEWLNQCAGRKFENSGMSGNLLGHEAQDFGQKISLWLLANFANPEFGPTSDDPCPAVGLAVRYPYDVPFRFWIAKVQSFWITDTIRRAQHCPTYIDVEDAKFLSNIDFEKNLDCMSVDQEIAGLPGVERQILEMWAHGVKVEDIAKELGVSKRVVYNNRRQALDHLHNRLISP